MITKLQKKVKNGGFMENLGEKIYQVLKVPQVYSLATVTEQKPWVRYIMGYASPDLEIRFVTSLKTRKISHIEKNPEVHLSCGAKDSETTEAYLQIQGKARISTDPELCQKMWNDNLKVYFSGPEDPNYCVVVIRPYRIEYQTLTNMTPEIWEA